ncbi:GNAT family N-acetyltransferase [Anabaena subtropica]|uniref:GNAT family N-acetyltransferase n=1 Tax=Anabaena subtropica FACHB-260 TaxID=2692884 RepID=A0ABR8CTD1_9NOST|nr:GNAT family N-acetyltransferase [Anabaena subtropica]MBD2345045.1 GNAT family N-acetyltransferase [Anabaena subtropica FACHB-260]
MDNFPTLETQRLLLRQEKPEDAGAVFEVFSNPKVTQFHDLDTFTNIEEAFSLIERRTKRFETGQGIRWGITRQLDNIVIGSCGFTWDKQAHSAEIGYELNSTYWRQGIMKEALQAILQYGFFECNLQYVIAEVMLDNIASKKLLCKLGFQNQGVLKQHGFWKGQYHDLEQFILTLDCQ